MNATALFSKIRPFFSQTVDLMRHLKSDACWEYFVTNQSVTEENAIVRFFLRKIDDNSLELSKEPPLEKPDLILYFTKDAILKLIEGNPSVEEYYTRYREIMKNPKVGIELDSKVNKPRFKLLKLGYRMWQKDFKF